MSTVMEFKEMVKDLGGVTFVKTHKIRIPDGHQPVTIGKRSCQDIMVLRNYNNDEAIQNIYLGYEYAGCFERVQECLSSTWVFRVACCTDYSQKMVNCLNEFIYGLTDGRGMKLTRKLIQRKQQADSDCSIWLD